jgi:hypothetical protein
VQAKEPELPAARFGPTSDYYDNRTTALDVVHSYYNAIGLGQLSRAFSYTLHGTPEEDGDQLATAYQAFRTTFDDVGGIEVRFGAGFTSAGVGTEVTAIPVIMSVQANDGARALYSACHYAVQLSASAQDYVPFDPIRIDATFSDPVTGDFETNPMPDCRF